jgi:hypothetical protein
VGIVCGSLGVRARVCFTVLFLVLTFVFDCSTTRFAYCPCPTPAAAAAVAVDKSAYSFQLPFGFPAGFAVAPTTPAPESAPATAGLSGGDIAGIVSSLCILILGITSGCFAIYKKKLNLALLLTSKELGGAGTAGGADIERQPVEQPFITFAE